MNTRTLIPAALLIGAGWLGAPAAAEPAYAWQAPSPQSQLANDRTEVPVGKGAIFVPAISSPDDEPDVLLVDAGSVRKIDTGRRVIVEPGRYVVVVGAADPKDAVGVPVRVLPGRTELVPVAWGALRVEVVTRKLERFDGAYELIHVASGRRVFLQESAADDQELRTWLLEPGLYRFAELGSDNLNAPDFVTVHIPKGGLVNFRLFMDRRTGNFLGGGVVPLDRTLPEPDEGDESWDSSLAVGLNGTANQIEHVAGFPDQTFATGSFFVNGRADWRSSVNAVTLRGELEEGQQFIETGGDRALPLIKAQDRLAGDAFYALSLNPGVGLYARVGLETQLFETGAFFIEDTEVALRSRDGGVEYIQVDTGEQFTVAEALSPTRTRAGGGLNIRFLNVKWADLSVRGGPGWRWNSYAGSLISEDNPNTPALEYTELYDFQQQGFEATAAASFRIKGIASVSSELDTFVEFGDFTRPYWRWDNNVSLRLSNVVSVNYLLDIGKFPQLSESLQLRQGAYLQASWSLL